MEFIGILTGFVLLIFGANMLVEGVTKIAKRFKIPTIIISMTIIAIGTSIPELVVACISSFKQNQITLSNIIGSNISAISICIGISALFYPVILKWSIKNEIIKMLIIQVLLLVLLIMGREISQVDGIIFIMFFVFYILYIVNKAKKGLSEKDGEDYVLKDHKYIELVERIIPKSIITISIFIVFGLISVMLGGNFVVDSAITIARDYGLSEAFIGSTIVALGTSLPELATSIIASRRKEYDIISGNIVGSGILNILLIVGIASLIHPIKFSYIISFQISFMMLLGLFLFYISNNKKVSKSHALTLLFFYTSFILSSLYLSELLQDSNLLT